MKLEEFKDLVVNTEYQTDNTVWFSEDTWDSFYKDLKADIILNIEHGAKALAINIDFPKPVNNAIVLFLTKVFSGFDISVSNLRTVIISDPSFQTILQNKTIMIRAFPKDL